MKLATLKTGRRDGTLVVVNRELTLAVAVPEIALTLQAALDDWEAVESRLRKVYSLLCAGKMKGTLAFNPRKALAPLPRAYQWADGSAYVNHVELVRKSRGVEMPQSFWTDPLMYQGGSDMMLGPCDDIPLPDESHGIDFEAEVAVITDDVPMAVTAEDARAHIKLLMLVNDVSLRHLAMNELQKGFGFFQCKPASAFSPVAITPDELGAAWDGGKVHLPLITHYNGAPFGSPNAGEDMVFDFPTLIAHAARTRFLTAGTIVGSGTVSNKDRSVGSSCIVEKRILEKMEESESKTPFMHFGDTVKIEMLDADSQSLFGAIDQKVVKYTPRMKLYTYFQSSASYRVRIALNLKGLEAEMAYVNLLKAEQRVGDYAKLNPQMVVPTLIDKGHALGQSLAIMEYLEEAYPNPPLLPKDPFARAYVRQVALAIACEIAPLGNLKVRNYLGEKLGQSKDMQKEWTRHWIEEGLASLEKLIAGSGFSGRFCCADTPGMADCCLMPQLFNAKRFHCDLAPYPYITRVAKEYETHPAFVAAHPSKQKDFVS